MELTKLTSSISLMLAISIAMKRMVEILKSWFPDTWLFQPNGNSLQEAHRCAGIYVLSGLGGSAIAAAGSIDVFQVIGIQGDHTTDLSYDFYRAVSWSINGFLVSRGSAFWNHTLDLIKPTKLQQQQRPVFNPRPCLEGRLATRW